MPSWEGWWHFLKKVYFRAVMFDSARKKMVMEQILSRGVTDTQVLAAMRKVPRHLFVPLSCRSLAYADGALSIGDGQTISQPYIVAFMTQTAHVGSGSRVLEIGTGSGYQTAMLAEIANEVYSIEIIQALADQAVTRLAKLGYKNVKIKQGDGYKGWPEQAPFDAIMVTAAPLEVPSDLLGQLKVGGCMVVPVGDTYQDLRRITRTESGFEEESLMSVVFVPMVTEKKNENCSS
jgi:protein-L-isoaspartate(D-aspartate) O-methyltransferase